MSLFSSKVGFTLLHEGAPPLCVVVTFKTGLHQLLAKDGVKALGFFLYFKHGLLGRTQRQWRVGGDHTAQVAHMGVYI